jgi:predicted dehydrogenase
MGNTLDRSSRADTETRVTPLKTVLIGLGAGPEKILLPGLTSLPEIDLVAACDLDSGTRDRVARRWHIPKSYSDASEMLEAEKPDLVVIGTPPKTHYKFSLLALEQGAHLLCEKPFMTSLAEADEVLTKARQCQRWVGVNSQYYQMPIYRRLQTALDRDEAGRLYQIDAWQHMYLLPNEEGGWKADLMPRRVLLEFGTHAIDLICRFFGNYPEAVSARIARARHDIDADVCITVRLDFPGDRVANLVFNRMSYSPMRYFEMRLNCEKAALRASLGGLARLDLGWNSHTRRPKVRWSLTRGGEARLERDGDSKLISKQDDAAFGSAAALHLAGFAQAILQGREQDVYMDTSRKMLQVLLACYESAENCGTLITL